MSQNKDEKDDKYLAKQVIRDLDWMTFIYPDESYMIEIPRTLLDQVTSRMDDPDFMDAGKLIAGVGVPHFRRLKAMEYSFGQTEALELKSPLPEALHFLYWEKAGKPHCYVSAFPFFPYR
jgi:hypothetical protein